MSTSPAALQHDTVSGRNEDTEEVAGQGIGLPPAGGRTGYANGIHAQPEEVHAKLDAAGYCAVTENDLEALQQALVDAAEAERGRELLDAAGYCAVTENDSEALQLALVDAAEAERARGVVAAHQGLFDADDPAEALEEAVVVMEEHERVFDVLADHDLLTGGGLLLDVLDDVACDAVEAGRARELLYDAGRMREAEDLPQAVQELLSELRELRGQLVDIGYLR